MAWSVDRSQRWRQFSLALATLVSVTAMMLGAGIVSGSQSSAERVLARTPSIDFASTASPIHAVVRGGFLDGRQFPVLWVEPQVDDAPLPPGLTRLPEPGTYVVSPALAAAGVADALGWAMSSAGSGVDGAIGTEGLASPSELYAYARPAEGRTLGAGGALAPVSGFGVADETAPQVAVETDAIIPSRPAALFASLWLLVIPGLLIMVPAASSGSGLRAHRGRVLFLLGARPAELVALGALEAAALVLPVAVMGVVACAILAPHVGFVPVAGIEVNAGDLGVPAWQQLVIVLACVGVAATVGALLQRPGDATARGPARRRVMWVSAIPLWLAVAGIVMSRLFTRPANVAILLVTLVATTLALPLALPWLVRRAGAPLSRLSGVGPWLAGRRIAADARGLSRPAATVALLVFVLGAGSGLYLQMTATSPPTGAGSFEVGWRGPQVGDFATIRDALPQASVGYQADDGTLTFESCPELARAFPGNECGDPGDLVALAQDALSVRVDIGAVDEATGDDVVANTAVVLAPPGDIDLDDVQAAASSLPAANVAPSGDITMLPPYIAQWFAAALVAAALLLGAAATIAFGNRVLSVADEDRALLSLGAGPMTVRSVQRWSLAAPVAIAIPAAGGAAIVFTWAASTADLAVTATGVIALECAAAAAMSAAVLAGLAASQRRAAGQ
ncbi:hypothetical protein CWIS_14615 [Cellulomonas sp. A375-1]|nr:hypothetical protein CWIS_14615 [Cellulomonas sp. A375-1]